jgi:hypothetical protein
MEIVIHKHKHNREEASVEDSTIKKIKTEDDDTTVNTNKIACTNEDINWQVALAAECIIQQELGLDDAIQTSVNAPVGCRNTKSSKVSTINALETEKVSDRKVLQVATSSTEDTLEVCTTLFDSSSLHIIVFLDSLQALLSGQKQLTPSSKRC